MSIFFMYLQVIGFMLYVQELPLFILLFCLSVFTEEEEEWWADDASDFDLDSDSEGEGERLCNTAMLTGPLGVGKTASVYALAQELGFKVMSLFISINQFSCIGVIFSTEFNFVKGVK